MENQDLSSTSATHPQLVCRGTTSPYPPLTLSRLIANQACACSAEGAAQCLAGSTFGGHCLSNSRPSVESTAPKKSWTMCFRASLKWNNGGRYARRAYISTAPNIAVKALPSVAGTPLKRHPLH